MTEPAAEPATEPATQPATAERRIAPYGAWASSTRIDEAVGGRHQLAEPWLHGDDTYWLEGRPSEGGRRVLVRAAPDGTTTDLTPPSRGQRLRPGLWRVSRR